MTLWHTWRQAFRAAPRRARVYEGARLEDIARLETLAERRGEETVTLGWLAERLRDFVDLNPDFEVPVERFATWLARADDEDE